MKKEKGATSSAKERKAKSERAAGSNSGMKDEERVIKQEGVSISRQRSNVDSDSSPERPLIEVLRSMRRNGAIAENSASGHVGMGKGAAEESGDDRGRKGAREVGQRGGRTRGGR